MSNTAVWRWSSMGRTGVWIDCQSARDPVDWGVVWGIWVTSTTEEAASPEDERKMWRSFSGKAPQSEWAKPEASTQAIPPDWAEEPWVARGAMRRARYSTREGHSRVRGKSVAASHRAAAQSGRLAWGRPAFRPRWESCY